MPLLEAGLLGKLVHLDKRERRQRTLPAQGGAQIYLFTGVRYERDGTPVPGKRPAKAKRKRV